MHLKILHLLWASLLALLPLASAAQTVSLTFDDGLDPDKQPLAATWNRQILTRLEVAGVQAMLFPSLVRVGGERGLDLVREWAAEGHAIGNHTSRHRSLASKDVTASDFIADVQEADVVLRQLPNWRPMLRFPYLKEGDTQEKRDGVRAWMASHGYRAAPVSIDASDWYYNQIFSKLLDEGSQKKAFQVKVAYVDHLLDRAEYYDQLARQVLGRSPKHVMLLHTNRINAEAINDVIEAFKRRGWTFVSPQEAFQDAVYRESIDTLPAGESVIWARAKQAGVAGLRYPAEDSVYEEPKLRARQLLPAAP